MAQLALQNLSPGRAKLSSGKHLSARLGRKEEGRLTCQERGYRRLRIRCRSRFPQNFGVGDSSSSPCSSAQRRPTSKAPPSSTLHPPARKTAPIHTNSTPHDRVASLFTLPACRLPLPLPSGRRCHLRRHRGRHTPLCSTAGEDKMIFATALVALGLAVGGGTAGQQALHTASRQNLI